MPRTKKKENLLAKAAKYCARKETSEFEIRQKLIQWGASEPEVQTIVQYLIDNKFVDDERFTEFFIRDKYNFNGWGKLKIKYALIAKGISEELFERKWSELIDQQAYRQKAKELLEKKYKEINSEPDLVKLKAKLYNFAVGRGFEPELVYEILDEMINW